MKLTGFARIPQVPEVRARGLADINPLNILTPWVSGKAGRNPQDITLYRIRTQCTTSFSVTGKGVLKAKFQD